MTAEEKLLYLANIDVAIVEGRVSESDIQWIYKEMRELAFRLEDRNIHISAFLDTDPLQ